MLTASRPGRTSRWVCLRRGQVNDSAAKGALNSATKQLALELASRGITVNAIAPGIIDAGMAEADADPATIQRLMPMKRAGSAGAVAALVAFLASAAAPASEARSSRLTAR